MILISTMKYIAKPNIGFKYNPMTYFTANADENIGQKKKTIPYCS